MKETQYTVTIKFKSDTFNSRAAAVTKIMEKIINENLKKSPEKT